MQKNMFEEILAENYNCVKIHRTVQQKENKVNFIV